MSYAHALFAGEFAAASRYVDPASRGAFLALTAGLGASAVRSNDLAAGHSTVNGAAAVVILTGTICSTGSMASLSPAPAPPSAQCVTNRDPHSTTPVFRVDLAREADGRWMVAYRMPSPGGAAAAPEPVR